MNFRFLPLDAVTRPQWDQFTRAHPEAWVGHQLAALELDELLGRRSLAHLVLDERDQVAAVSPVTLSQQRVARLFSVRQLDTGDSLRGGPLLAAGMAPKPRREFWQAWNTHIRELAAREGADRVQVNFPHLLGERHVSEAHEYHPLLDHGFEQAPALTMLIDLAAAGEDLLPGFDPKCRNKIRRAQAAGAEVVPVETREHFLEFDAMQRSMYEDEGLAPCPRPMIELLWDRFISQGLARAMAVRHEGRFACIGIWAIGPSSGYNWFTFTQRPRPLAGATNLLVYHFLLWLRANGRRYAEIGSMEFGDPRQQAIAEFKRSFGGRVWPAMNARLELSPIKRSLIELTQALAARRRAGRRAAPAPPPAEPPNEPSTKPSHKEAPATTATHG